MRLKSAETFRALIRQKGLSYAGVARYAECHKSFIGALASSNEKNLKRSCSKDKAILIAEVLDVPLHVLFDDSPSTVRGRNGVTQSTRGAMA